MPGYTIDFADFDLGAPFEADYHLERLPNPSKHMGVYLSIADPTHELEADDQREKLIAAVQFEVTDEQGQLVCQVDQPLAKMIWAAPEGGADCYGLYQLDRSFFDARSEGKYRLRIRYTPDPKLIGFRGFVHIRCGGSI
ncbi:MAG: hypothetical protein AB7U73_03735 [Pirellulales bacterium]